MKKLSVTYKAPPGDSKVVEAFGHTFYDGKSETVTVDDRIAAKMQANPHFKCGEASDAKAEAHEATEAETKAAEDADKAKAEAQGTSPPLRCAQSNPRAPAAPETPETRS